MNYSFTHCHHLMHTTTGIVVPVYIPKIVDTDQGQALLQDNVAALLPCVDNPSAICLSVDGKENGQEYDEEI